MEACDVFVRAAGLGNARSLGSWLREGQCPGGAEPVIPSCGLIRLWPRMYQRCLAEFSAEVAPQTSLRRSFEHARTLGLSGVRDYLHLASATVAVWAQHSWPQNWGHRGNMPLHLSVTQKITENWFHFWGHSATEFEGFPLVLIGPFAHAWVPRRPGKAWDAALSTRKRYRAIYTHGAQRQNVKIFKDVEKPLEKCGKLRQSLSCCENARKTNVFA